MADIVTLLRDQHCHHEDWLREMCLVAASEIERLRDALMKIEYLDRPQVRGKIQEIALAALDNNNG